MTCWHSIPLQKGDVTYQSEMANVLDQRVQSNSSIKIYDSVNSTSSHFIQNSCYELQFDIFLIGMFQEPLLLPKINWDFGLDPRFTLAW